MGLGESIPGTFAGIGPGAILQRKHTPCILPHTLRPGIIHSTPVLPLRAQVAALDELRHRIHALLVHYLHVEMPTEIVLEQEAHLLGRVKVVFLVDASVQARAVFLENLGAAFGDVGVFDVDVAIWKQKSAFANV
jgi:hypothetical protein